MFRFVFLFCLALLTSSCARAGYVGPYKAVGTALAPAQASQLVNSATTTNLPDSFRALYRANIKVSGHELSLRYGIVFKQPDNFRLDVLPTNAAYTLANITERKGQVRYFERDKGTTQLFDSSRAVLEREFHLPLSSLEVVALLNGKVALDQQKLSADWNCYASLDRIECNSLSAHKFLTLSNDGRLNSYQLRNQSNDTVLLQVDFLGLDTSLWLPARKAKVTLKEVSKKLDSKIPEELFE